MSVNSPNSTIRRQGDDTLGGQQEVVITAPAPAAAETKSTQSQSITANSNQPTSTASHFEFVTFDDGRKHLARVVADQGENVIVRRYDKKSGKWRTKDESRERKACITLTAGEAEMSFPGCGAVCAKGAQFSTQSDGKVKRQMSPNLAAPIVTAPAFQSIDDFLFAYTDKKKTIDELTNKFVVKAGEAKRAQDDILPHLSYMQSLLSKKGTNHHLVIEARKQGEKIPWWTEYYETYKERLWESLRTMERRIAAYRNDPTSPVPKRGTDPVPYLNKAAQKVLIEGNHKAVEIVAAIEAGRDAKEEIADFKEVMNATRLDDIMQAQEQEPDYKSILIKIVQKVANMKSSLPAMFVKAVCELTEPCKFNIAVPVTTQKSNGSATSHVHTDTGVTSAKQKRMRIAPLPQKPLDTVPLHPGKKYTTRPHPQGGWGVYEPASTVCLQKHPSQEAAWDAIEAVIEVST